jgi:Cu/Ag efflux protein CusF
MQASRFERNTTLIRALVTLFLVIFACLPALAEKHQASPALTDGEVRKVDMAAKRITIKHGPIRNLDMPAMTMAFPVANPALLEQFKPGDKVRFEAQNIGDTVTVTAIEKLK